MTEYEIRKLAMDRHLKGEAPCTIYRSLKRSSTWFFKWLKRYQTTGDTGLHDQSRAPLCSPNKIPTEIEQVIVAVRRTLAAHDTEETKYSPIGADSVSWELTKLYPEKDPPSITTINRVIRRNGLLETSTLPKRESLPYPTPIAVYPNSVHQLDDVGPRHVRGSDGLLERFFSVNLVDCYSRMAATRPYGNVKTTTLIDFLIFSVWNHIGIPEILQVDNMLAVKGSNRHPRSPGAMIRLCLLMGVEVLFIPVNEPQRNGTVESFNNTFDRVFFRRQSFQSLKHLEEEAVNFQRRYCTERPHTGLKVKQHGSKVPASVHFRHPVRTLPCGFSIKEYEVSGRLKIPLSPGKISFIRLVSKYDKISLFSEQFAVPPGKYRHQYVKATIFTGENILRMTHEDGIIKEEPYILKP
ncbi:MAG: integrase core domain-containing protein [Armatimonadota bacterium]|nr:integrase core domain-containing protein [Bacillota bacterium]